MASFKKGIIDEILNILEKCIKNPEQIDFKTRKSKNGKYISITVTFEAKSKGQLDKLYNILNAHEQIHMVL